MYKYFKKVSGVGTVNFIYFWKSKSFYDENITAPTTSDYSLNPQVILVKRQQYNKGSCLKQDEITYTYGIIVNIYIVYEISKHFNISTYSTLENCLFGELVWQKMLILISTNILDMESDLIDMDFFSS